MRGSSVKSRVLPQRPQSAKPAKGYLPGVTTAPLHSMAHLFSVSKDKDVNSKQLELEKSRSKLMIHAEAKRNDQERQLIQGRYEEAMKVLGETQSSRLKIISEQHEFTTEMLLNQFRQEVEALKQTHQMQLDRLKEDIEFLKERQQDELRRVKEEYSLQARQKDERVRDLIGEIKADEELSYSRKLDKELAKLEEWKKQHQIEVKEERDRQIKQVIDKLYDEHRLEIKLLQDKHQTTRQSFQAFEDGAKEVFKQSTPYQQLQASRDGSNHLTSINSLSCLAQRSNESSSLLRLSLGPSMQLPDNRDEVLIESLQRTAEISTQTETHRTEASTMTIGYIDAALLESKHNQDLDLVRRGFEAVLDLKNKHVNDLEEQLKVSARNLAELESLLSELASC